MKLFAYSGIGLALALVLAGTPAGPRASLPRLAKLDFARLDRAKLNLATLGLGSSLGELCATDSQGSWNEARRREFSIMTICRKTTSFPW